jgi:hypothetical protein
LKKQSGILIRITFAQTAVSFLTLKTNACDADIHLEEILTKGEIMSYKEEMRTDNTLTFEDFKNKKKISYGP